MRGLTMTTLLHAIVALILNTYAAPPDPPVNLLPPDGGTAVEANAQLCASVTDPQALPLDVRYFARDLDAQVADEFTIIAIPDTQYYAQVFPHIYDSQIEWIVQNRKALNIVFVSHLGDIVQNAENRFEWDNADAAMSLLDQPALTELPDGIPYGLALGNHDQYPSNRAGYPESGGTTTTETYNEYYGVDRFAGREYYGGNFGENNDNSYQLFSTGGYDFIFVHHEFDDTYVTMLDLVLPWTDQLLRTYRDRRAILAAHALLCIGVNCPSTLWAEFSTQGQMTYDALKHHKNLSLMMCGHAGTSEQQARRSDTWDGHTIHTFLADYQRGENCPFRCGNGWLRILTFRPAANEVHVQTYSPWLDEYRSDPCSDGSSCHEFTLPYDLDDGIPFRMIGSLSGVPSGADACLSWPGRQANGQYEWYVEAGNGSEYATGPRWNFASNGACTAHAECEDGDPCTDDLCKGHKCSWTIEVNCCAEDVDCDDGNYCTDDTCVGGQCQQANNTNACSDGDPCTKTDVCADGSCSGIATSCADGNGCTADSCADGACINTFAPTASCCVSDTDCDDGNPCTDDSCGPGGDCLSTPDPACCYQTADCDDGDTCTVDRCDRNFGAFRFDGVNDQAFVGRIDPLGKTYGLNARHFTLECWFKWDGTGELVSTAGWPFDQFDSGITAYPLVTKGFLHRDNDPITGVNYFLGIDESGVLAADLEEQLDGSNLAVNHRVYGDTPVSVGTWQHAAATYDGRCWQLYLDGVAQTDGTTCPRVEASYESQFMTSLASAQWITGSLLGRFAGLLDEVRVWDRAQSQEEIVANMHEQIVSAPHLMGRWALDAIDGVTFEDSTGNGHIGGVHDATVEPWDTAALSAGVCLNFGPSTVTGVDWESYPEPRLAWFDQPDMLFDVAGGLISEMRAFGGTGLAQCLGDQLAEPYFVDTRPDPPVGDGYYLIIRSAGACDTSSYGAGESGLERSVAEGCP